MTRELERWRRPIIWYLSNRINNPAPPLFNSHPGDHRFLGLNDRFVNLYARLNFGGVIIGSVSSLLKGDK